jgi:hypothetical protein
MGAAASNKKLRLISAGASKWNRLTGAERKARAKLSAPLCASFSAAASEVDRGSRYCLEKGRKPAGQLLAIGLQMRLISVQLIARNANKIKQYR